VVITVTQLVRDLVVHLTLYHQHTKHELFQKSEQMALATAHVCSFHVHLVHTVSKNMYIRWVLMADTRPLLLVLEECYFQHDGAPPYI
jgi:hypothetical protein